MSDLPPVKITLVANGIEGVTAAFKTIEDSARRMEQVMSQAAKKGEQNRTAAAQAGSKTRISAKDKEFAQLVRQTEKWGRDEINAEKRKNQQIEAEAKRSASARNSFFNKVASNSISSMQRVAGTAMRLAGAVAAIGGGFTIADALGAEVKNTGAAKALEINSRGALKKGEILSTAKVNAVTHGMTTEESLSGMDAFFAKTGDAKMAKESLQELGDLATATGADFKELATMAGLAWNSMSASEKKLLGKEGMMKLLRTQVAQGREGAMDIREFSQYGSRIFNTAAQFKGGVMENAEFIGALAQTSMERGTATDSAEATESVKSLGLDVYTHQKQLQAAGILGTTDKYGNLNNAQTVEEKLLLGTHGNVGQLEKVGIERRSIKALEGDAMIFRKVFEEQTKAGKTMVEAETASIQAVRDAHKKYIGIIYGSGDVQKESASRMEEVDKQLNAAFEKLKITVGEVLLPKLVELMPKLEALIPSVAKLMSALVDAAGWIAENPMKAAMLGMAGIITKSVTEAFAAQFIQGLMTKGMSGMTLGTSIPLMLTAGTVALYYSRKEEETQFRKNSKAAGAQEADTDIADIKTLEGMVGSGPKSMSAADVGEYNQLKQELANQRVALAKKIDDLNDKRLGDSLIMDKYRDAPGTLTQEEYKRVEKIIGSNYQENDKAKGYLEEAAKLGVATADKNKLAADTMLEAAKALAEKSEQPYGPPKGPPKPSTDGTN